MTNPSHVIELLRAARAEVDAPTAVGFLSRALTAGQSWVPTGGDDARILTAQVLQDLARESKDPRQRTEYWRQAVSMLQRSPGDSSLGLADAYLETVVDAASDGYSDQSTHDRQSLLRVGRQRADKWITSADNNHAKATLLARKSSVLRHLAIREFPSAARRFLEEAHRSATKAMSLSDAPSIRLELALATWGISRFKNEDTTYLGTLNEVEALLLDPQLQDLEVGRLTLARYYRMQWRPLEACEVFLQLTGRSVNRRRVLRDSIIYAEAAEHLSYREYPSETKDLHLAQAAHLLEGAIAAGYPYARIIVDLALVEGALGNASRGMTALHDLGEPGKGLSWNRVTELLSRVSPTDWPMQALALGIDSSAVITRLGTFVWRYQGNAFLAENLYRSAVNLNGRNQVALTNLARHLARTGDPNKLNEARRILQKASNFADRRFHWWKAVMAELNSGESVSAVSRSVSPIEDAEAVARPRDRSYDAIKKRYKQAFHLEDKQRRGYELEELFYSLATLSMGVSSPSYRLRRLESGKIHGLDVFFVHGAHSYRAECKWTEKPTTYEDMLTFADKLDVVGVSGLFVSMSGFVETAIQKAEEVAKHRAILLMDGPEIELLMGHQIELNEAMQLKRLRLDQESKVYWPVKPAIQF